MTNKNHETDQKTIKQNYQKQLDEAFYASSKHTVYVTENEPDRAALRGIGANAISVNSYGYTEANFIDQMSIKPTQKKLIFCPAMKNRDHWKEIKKQIQESRKIKIEILPVRYYFRNQTVSDAANNTQSLSEFMREMGDYIADEEEKANPNPGNIAEYFQSRRYQEDIAKFRQGAEVRTGFSKLDTMIGGGLYAGLYVIGAVPTLGKTTFCLQMADQIAEQRRPVLFFSMEQSRLELVSKSISRTARENNPGNQTKILTSLQIRRGETSPTIEDAMKIYSKNVSQYMNIIEGNFETTIDTIRDSVKRHIDRNATRPVVFVDYLQILQPAKKSRATDPRVMTDQNVTALKRISRDFEIPVIVVSSFNRMNYKQTVDYESFKETSGIEYTADVLLGMEYSVIAQLDGKKPNDDREKVNDAKTAAEREIILKCLKNRYGQSAFDITFKYYPKYDYFREDTKSSRDRFKDVKMH